MSLVSVDSGRAHGNHEHSHHTTESCPQVQQGCTLGTSVHLQSQPKDYADIELSAWLNQGRTPAHAQACLMRDLTCYEYHMHVMARHDQHSKKPRQAGGSALANRPYLGRGPSLHVPYVRLLRPTYWYLHDPAHNAVQHNLRCLQRPQHATQHHRPHVNSETTAGTTAADASACMLYERACSSRAVSLVSYCRASRRQACLKSPDTTTGGTVYLMTTFAVY